MRGVKPEKRADLDRRLKCAECLIRLGFGFKEVRPALGLTHGTAARFWKARKDLARRGRSLQSIARLRNIQFIKIGLKPNIERRPRQAIFKFKREKTGIPASQVSRINAFIRESEAFFATGMTRAERMKKKAREREFHKYHNDPAHALLCKLRRRLRKLVYGSRSEHTEALIGCSLDHLMRHIESKFTKGMGWHNAGIWHIDHYAPCSMFDLEDINERHVCFNWRNLRPLWGTENHMKGDTVTDEALALVNEIRSSIAQCTQ